MEILFTFTKKACSFYLGGKVLVASESDSDDDSDSEQSKQAASVNGTGAKLAKAAVEHATIMIPALQHRRNLSGFNWHRGQSYDKTLAAALSTNEANGLGEKEDGQGIYPLRRTGKALADLKEMLEEHEVEFPTFSYEEFEEYEVYDSCKLETIWEEEEDEEDEEMMKKDEDDENVAFL